MSSTSSFRSAERHSTERLLHSSRAARLSNRILLLTRKLQILLEYFGGHSPNGQFYKDKVEYIGIGTHFHF